jgi:hypothetical protein
MLKIILRISTPSKFGKETETADEENIRKGIEILPHQLIMPQISSKIHQSLRNDLFKTGLVSLNFSKMAISQAGEHFEIHRDHIQNPDFQGTLLIEVCSEHAGGDLVLAHHGTEYRWSLTDSLANVFVFPKRHFSAIDPPLRYIAFSKDVIHRVEPVTSGVRIVLQYDILVTPATQRVGSWKLDTEPWDIKFTSYFPSPITDRLISKLCESLQEIISDLHGVALPLFHLYTDAQPTPNRLKMKDMQLFSFLIQKGYCVQLTPIIITRVKSEEEEEHENSVREASVMEIGYILSNKEDHQSIEGETETVSVSACPILDRPDEITYLATGYEQAMYLNQIKYSDTIETEYFCVTFLITTSKVLVKTTDGRATS